MKNREFVDLQKLMNKWVHRAEVIIFGVIILEEYPFEYFADLYQVGCYDSILLEIVDNPVDIRRQEEWNDPFSKKEISKNVLVLSLWKWWELKAH